MVEFHVEKISRNEDVTVDICVNWKEASSRAVTYALQGSPVNLDVVCYSEKDALSYGGEEGLERYREDPNASVFERYVIRVECKGRVG